MHLITRERSHDIGNTEYHGHLTEYKHKLNKYVMYNKLIVAIAMILFIIFFFTCRRKGVYKMHHLNIKYSAAISESQT